MKKILMISVAVAALASCSKDKDPLIIVPPSSGSQMTLNGLDGSEGGDGSKAANSVFVDFSADKQYTVARKNWDLGFYTGSDFRAIINNTAVAYAKATTKTDLNAVGSADTVGLKLEFDQNVPTAADFTMMDNLNGNISQTLISASATETDNKVFILNRGTGGGIVRSQNQYMKLRVLRNSNGYTLQYAPLTANTYNTLSISKTGDGDFVYISLDNGNTVSGFPAKIEWDIEWTYSAYKTNFGVDVMYPFSDLVALNQLNGVQAFERVYSGDAVASDAFTKFNKDSVAKYTFSSDRWTIGSNWRATAGTPAGIKHDRFYIIKDASGNYYKLKFIAMGPVGYPTVVDDGGTRGKPEIQYELIK
ncbi:hypothetical protein A8C56_20120 [Niabella ginsenosidivorans]|uniref:HmuY protein n=1 Tax=Niabella ginsenosidivorans TaxID=1176587 RepID=A0A1A9I5Z7_9BACT|nr:HmuY family protein [Niabella ginsenosidivorans]ANH82983.1 hypothetical protein A8C56_20120 [Niabella ginsenosidivorans]